MVEKKTAATGKKVAKKVSKTRSAVKQNSGTSLLSMLLNKDVSETTLIEMVTLMKDHLYQQHQHALELTKMMVAGIQGANRTSDEMFEIYYRAVDAVMEHSLVELMATPSNEQTSG